MMSALRSEAVKMVAVLALVVTTVLLFDIDVRYEVSGVNLLANSAFQDGLDDWDIVGSKNGISWTEGHIEIGGRSEPKSIGIRQRITVSSEYEALRIEAEAATDGLVTAKGQSFPALIHVVCQDEDGRSLYGRESHFVSFVLPAQTGGWRPYRDVLILPDAARSCLSEGYLTKYAEGSLKIRAFRVFPVSERDKWDIFSYAILGLWGLVALWLAVGVGRSIKQPLMRLILLAAGGLVGLSSFVPKPIKFEVGDWLLDAYARILGMAAGLLEPLGVDIGLIALSQNPSKLGHVVLFALLAGIARLAWPSRGVAMLGVHLGLFAASAEVIQYFAMDRHPMITDWALDLVGVVIGLSIIGFANVVVQRPTVGR